MAKIRLHAEQRRIAIVEAAAPLFARYGFAGTTTKQIAAAAGVSEALLFQHFPSKAALYREILRLGCEGDPGMARLSELQPSTASLVEMVQLMVRHVVLGEACARGEPDVEARLALHSLVEDGEYVRLVSDWVAERVLPKYLECHNAAEQAGDVRPAAGDPANSFWFAYHAAAMTAFGRLSGRPAFPYAGPLPVVLSDLTRFVLRGIGLEDRVIETHLGGQSLAAAE
jgi:AcrR family transcriptional regulator